MDSLSTPSSAQLESFPSGGGGGGVGFLFSPFAAGQLLHSVTGGLLSRFPFLPNNSGRRSTNASNLGAQGPMSCSSPSVSVPVAIPFHCSARQPAHGQGPSSSVSSALGSLSTSVRIDGLSSGSSGGGGGPAFVGQVFSMCDPSGTGLMAVTTNFDIPFLSKRTPDWIKKMLATITRRESSGPVFRFFMDLGDAVSYVKRLNIPTGMVGACRLDVAYGHFKEKPHMFQFVPNAKQVKAANKLLKANRRRSGQRKLDGVPVFTAQNLNIAIATNDGIKWYTPYFFDKNLLDNILEASVDQHFHSLIQTRHGQRRRDAVDDNLAAEVVEDNTDSLFEPPEVQEVLDEMGHPGIPLGVISKVAEIQLLDVVDKVLLGNKWLRKATGIQPKFPYLVDSFETRSGASVLKTKELACSHADEAVTSKHPPSDQCLERRCGGFHAPFSDWFPNPWLKPPGELKSDDALESKTRKPGMGEESVNQTPLNPLLPKITMVGISTSETGKVSKASLRKTMEDLTRELERTSQDATQSNEDKDPLFVANVGDYSTITRMSSV